MTSYYDPQSRTRKSAVYTWTDISGITWADLDTWELADGNQYTLGTQTLVFLTDVIDHGKVEAVNPLCTVSANNTVNIKVYASDTFDSSSQISGAPVINGGQNATLQGVSGRYFQFQIEVEDTATALAEISSVEFNIEPRLQQEAISGNSATHTGTTQVRIAPIVKSYSKLTSVTGNAKAEIDKVPFITIGDLGNPEEPRYTVFSLSSTPNDSSTTIGIVDVINDTTITQVGTPIATQRTYKWSPASIEFGTVNPAGDGLYYGDGGGSAAYITTTFDDAIQIASDDFTIGSTSGQDFTIEFWVKIWGRFAHQSGVDPEYAHPDHFFNFTNGSEGLRLKTATQGTNNLEFFYQLDNDSTYTSIVSIANPLIAEGDWYFVRVKRTNSGIRVRIVNSAGDSDTEVTVDADSDKWGNISGDSTGSVWTLSLGDLDNPGSQQAALYMDDIKISSVAESSTYAPGAPFIPDGADDIVLINAGTTTVYPTSVTEVIPVDAEVNLVITGLPKMVSDASGNIIEGET